MIKKVIGLIIASLAITPFAYADGIRSPLGISQAEWNASATYQNFQCPANTSRGEGVDMNFTPTRSDDYYFVECSPIQEVIPTRLNYTPTEVATTPAQNTETTTAPQPVESSTPTLTPAPSITDTSTANTAPSITTVVTDTPTAIIKTASILDEELDLTWDWDKVLEWIVAWFEKWWQL